MISARFRRSESIKASLDTPSSSGAIWKEKKMFNCRHHHHTVLILISYWMEMLKWEYCFLFSCITTWAKLKAKHFTTEPTYTCISFGGNVENLDHPLYWNNKMGHFKSNRQFMSILLHEDIFKFLYRFRHHNKMCFYFLILGKSRFPPTKSFIAFTRGVIRYRRSFT